MQASDFSPLIITVVEVIDLVFFKLILVESEKITFLPAFLK